MLTKSAARLFFLAGTGLCTLAFVLLTLDTFQQIPDQTREQDLSAAAIRGKHLWEANNCMGCHTIMGEGAYYAPELTRVYERRGPEFIRAMLRDPAAMYPGQRRMQQYDFDDQEIEDLVAFFEWIGETDLNGFPPAPVLASTAAPSAGSTQPVAQGGRPHVFNQMCVACHSLEGRGGNVGPALDGVGDRFDEEYLGRWIRNPSAVRPGTAMPQLPLSDEQIDQLATYLSNLRAEQAL